MRHRKFQGFGVEHKNDEPRTVNNTVLNGFISGDRDRVALVFTRTLMGFCLLLGVAIAEMYNVIRTNERLATEVRIMQVHLENTNAILIRAGIKRPNDDEGTGPTGVH